MNARFCKQCGETRRAHFYPGQRGWCKACLKEWQRLYRGRAHALRGNLLRLPLGEVMSGIIDGKVILSAYLSGCRADYHRQYQYLCEAEADLTWRTKYNGPLELSAVEMLRKENLARQRQDLTNPKPPAWQRTDAQRWVIFLQGERLKSELRCYDVAG